MSISATMSVWGLYQISPTLFDGLSVPDGVDKENVKDNILLESENLEVLYSNPDFLKAAITVWSAERLPIWGKLYETTTLEYNPIENYDRMETGTNTSSGTSSGQNASTSSGENESVTSNTAYDSNTFADSAKAESSGSNSASNSGSNEFANTGTFTTRVHGNVGVTTSQEMIEAQRDVVKFCITSYIVEEFIDKFCIGVY